MIPFIRAALAGALVLLAPALASAAYSCSVSSGGFSAAYSPTTPTTTIAQTSLTVTCTRALSDAATMSYSVSANNGANPNGIHNRAAFGGSFLKYDLFKDGACATQWRSATTIAGTLSFSGSTSASVTVPFWGCVAAGQTGLPAGTYSDVVTMTLTYGPSSTTAVNTFPVSVSTPATCNLSTPPGDIVFNYTGFGATVNASTAFGVSCTSFLPYTMALDATSGTIVGVSYTLALSAASGTGSGAEQTYAINGNVAAGQAGTCATASCTASQARTLTITY